MMTFLASNSKKSDENKQVMTHLALLSQGYTASQALERLFVRNISALCYTSAIFYAILLPCRRLFHPYFDSISLFALNFNFSRHFIHSPAYSEIFMTQTSSQANLDSKRSIRTRIAPSPTGFPHVGTAYIALF